MEILDLANAFGPLTLQDPPVAAYVAKTITLGPRAGNPPPRILETAGGMINAIGLEGEGLDGFLRERLPLLRALPCPLIVSIAGFSVQEYVLLAEGLRRALEEGDRAAAGRWRERTMSREEAPPAGCSGWDWNSISPARTCTQGASP